MWFICPVLLLFCFGGCFSFDFPPPRIEVLTPKGFRVSVPDVEGSTLFAVHINVNEEMEGLEAGQFAFDIIKKKNGRWTYSNKTKRLKNGDILYFWLYLIVDGLGYRLDDQQYVVSGIPASTPTRAPSTTPPTYDIDVRGPDCPKSLTRVSGSSVCIGQTIFEDSFSDDLGKWSPEILFPDSPETDFTVFTNDHNTYGTLDGRLFVEPKLLDELTNETFVKKGTLELRGCTSRDKKNCKRTGISWSILPPVVSAHVTTKNSFSFLYGEVEIRAQLPTGDWIVPELWLEPKEVFYGPQSGRLLLAKILSNPSLVDSNNNECGASVLQQGYSLGNKKDKQFREVSPGGSGNLKWSTDFHLFKIRWTPDSIVYFVDNKEIGRVAPTSTEPLNPDIDVPSLLAPFDREFYLSLGVHVGGNEDFPDDSISSGKTKPWKNRQVKQTLEFWKKKSDWYPSWAPPRNRLLVDHVKVTAL